MFIILFAKEKLERTHVKRIMVAAVIYVFCHHQRNSILVVAQLVSAFYLTAKNVTFLFRSLQLF
jgi:hypothetical protein